MTETQPAPCDPCPVDMPSQAVCQCAAASGFYQDSGQFSPQDASAFIWYQLPVLFSAVISQGIYLVEYVYSDKVLSI